MTGVFLSTRVDEVEKCRLALEKSPSADLARTDRSASHWQALRVICDRVNARSGRGSITPREYRVRRAKKAINAQMLFGIKNSLRKRSRSGFKWFISPNDSAQKTLRFRDLFRIEDATL